MLTDVTTHIHRTMVHPQEDAPYPDGDGANIVINHDEDVGDVGAVSSSMFVIENISSVLTRDERQNVVAIIGNIDIMAPVGGDEAVQAAIVDAHDEASAASHLLSLSSATSATSIASALSDGASRPRSQDQHRHHQHQQLRPRSVSLNLPPTPATNSTPRSGNGTPIRSMSNSSRRPRSNPRTRTPMRHASPLLVTGRALQLDVTESTTTDDHRGGEMATSGGETTTHEGGANIEFIVDADAAAASNDNSNTTSSPRTDSPLTRIIRSPQRSGMTGEDDVIPEEEEEELAVMVEMDPRPVVPSANNHRPASLRHDTAHWLAQPSSSTVHNSTARRSSNNPARRRHSRPQHQDGSTRTLSSKQHPSHRKLRRWNNDRFVGTTSEHLHHCMMGDNNENTDGSSDYDQYWRQYYMPNYPCKYRSEFAKLVLDDTKKGQGVRDRFLKGEVGIVVGPTTTTMMTEDNMHRLIAEKFQKKLGVKLSSAVTVPTVTAVKAEKGAASNTAKTYSLSDVNESMGIQIFRNLSPRIQTILSRICATMHEEEEPVNGTTTTDPFFSMARKLVASFESYLISLALVESKKDVIPTAGYPPLQSQLTYDIFEKVFSSPPKIVMRSRRQCSGRHNVHALLIPTVHFYFETDDDNQDSNSKRGNSNGGKGGVDGGHTSDGGKKCNSAFHRILLHAVCQFHGLDSTSSVIQPNREGRSGQRNSEKGGVTMKVVTVQGGWLLAPSFKMLDACMSVEVC